MLLKINNLQKHYRKNIALHNISLTLTPGIYGLVGPNGAGKSTFMNIISGLITYDFGTVSCDEYEFLSNEYYQNFGYLPQYNDLYENFTCREFLSYICILKEIEDNKIIDEVLGLVNLIDKADKKIKSLSGGMKQRLSVCQTLLNDPKIILLDEPTAGLDPRERIRLKNILGQLAKNKIIIVSTHIISDMENLADKIILLKNGEVIACKKPNDLIGEVKKYFYEAIINVEELKDFKTNQITHIQPIASGYRIKFISKKMETYQLCNDISLEDVYLYYYGNDD